MLAVGVATGQDAGGISIEKKVEAIQRLLSGESAEAIADDFKVAPKAVKRWRDTFTSAGRAALEGGPVAPYVAEGPRYRITLLKLKYAEPAPSLPSLEELRSEVSLKLAGTPSGYVRWREGLQPRRVQLDNLLTLPDQWFYASAVRHMSQQIVAELNERGFAGVRVVPDSEHISASGEDLRADGQGVLRMIVDVGRVDRVRTVGSGERVSEDEKVNNAAHQRIRENSPVTPEADGKVLRKDEVKRYTHWLNRHPGRRVETAVTPGKEPGHLGLDYLVQENKPWTAYFQISNTGTEQTSEWRERFGFVHNQLTGNDDILNLSYSTASFDDAHAFLGSYEAPFPGFERLRWGINGKASTFTASDVGFAGEDFSGDSHGFGGELMWNFYQRNELFVDLVGGISYDNIAVDNEVLGVDGKDSFFRPHVGLEAERVTETSRSFASLTADWNMSSVAGTEDDEIQKLGRLATDEDFTRLRWNLSHSFYLEPLLNREAWEDPNTPESSTLAHEIAGSIRGQYVLNDDRVIPQYQRSIGGLYSVRGYEESLITGDNAVVASLEYRYHIPRAFGIESEPNTLFGEPFRHAPQNVYGRPDWDLIARSFVDYGRTAVNDGLNFEREEDLLSAGVGVELLFKQNASIRVDWGFALEDVEDRATAGSSQVHIVATFLY